MKTKILHLVSDVLAVHVECLICGKNSPAFMFKPRPYQSGVHVWASLKGPEDTRGYNEFLVQGINTFGEHMDFVHCKSEMASILEVHEE